MFETFDFREKSKDAFPKDSKRQAFAKSRFEKCLGKGVEVFSGKRLSGKLGLVGHAEPRADESRAEGHPEVCLDPGCDERIPLRGLGHTEGGLPW